MNKKELIDIISENIGLTKKEAQNFIESVIDVISNTLVQGDKVQISGFAKFSVLNKKTKKGINPQTKSTITIPSRRVPKFKAGKNLREALN